MREREDAIAASRHTHGQTDRQELRAQGIATADEWRGISLSLRSLTHTQHADSAHTFTSGEIAKEREREASATILYKYLTLLLLLPSANERERERDSPVQSTRHQA